MKTNQRIRRTGGAAACALLLLALTGGTALAAAVPSTTAYHFSSHPMISGTVVSVNDRQMVVDTDQGEQVALEIDSNTMAPRDLAPGMVVRAEFQALENCRFHAQRVIPLRGNMSVRRFQAYANSRDSREAIAGNASAQYGERRIGGEGWESQPQTVGGHSPDAVMTATPGTAAFRYSTEPMVSGNVIAVNDHRLVVETDQGQRVALVMDSNTMVPGDISPGSNMRAEFREMKDGRYYATRVSRIGRRAPAREQAYAHTRDSDWAIAQNVSDDCGSVRADARNTTSSEMERRGTMAAPEPVVSTSASVPAVERPKVLPQTASRQPLVLLAGLLALGAAGGLTVIRALRVV